MYSQQSKDFKLIYHHTTYFCTEFSQCKVIAEGLLLVYSQCEVCEPAGGAGHGLHSVPARPALAALRQLKENKLLEIVQTKKVLIFAILIDIPVVIYQAKSGAIELRGDFNTALDA